MQDFQAVKTALELEAWPQYYDSVHTYLNFKIQKRTKNNSVHILTGAGLLDNREGEKKNL